MKSGIVVCCLMVLILSTIAVAEFVTDGLVTYYTLDQRHITGKTVKDVVGGKDGTIQGDPEIIAGHLGNALDFGGPPDAVELPQIMKIGKGPVTYECWFKKTDTSSWQYLISNKNDFHNNFFRFGFNQNTGQIRFYTEHENEANKAWVTAEDYADGVWHHTVATRDEAVGKVYVDGELVKQDVAMNGDIGGDISNWYLAQNGGPGNYLIGAMDEVRIYDRALTEDEVRQNFESEAFSVSSGEDKLSITWGMIKEIR